MAESTEDKPQIYVINVLSMVYNSFSSVIGAYQLMHKLQ